MATNPHPYRQHRSRPIPSLYAIPSTQVPTAYHPNSFIPLVKYIKTISSSQSRFLSRCTGSSTSARHFPYCPHYTPSTSLHQQFRTFGLHLSKMTITSDDVIHHPSQTQFTLSIPGIDEPAIIRYNVAEVNGTTIYDMYSTRVPEAIRGQGVAAKLVRGAFAIARHNGVKVIPTCPYIPVYLQRHPDDADVISE